MAEEKVTTIQIDVETRDKLKALAVAFERTAAGQLRWLVNQDYEKLLAAKCEPNQPVERKEVMDMKQEVKEQGQGMVEYALILVLVAVVVIAAVTIMGPLVGNVFSTINASL